MQRSIGSRLIAAAARPAVRRFDGRLYSSSSSSSSESPLKTSASDAPGPQPGQNELVSQENAAQALSSHQPDYNVVTDYRTSSFSPIPKRVIDGSEPTGSVPAAVLSGAPVDLQGRTVRIYRPTKPATQSGDWHSHHWLMDWDPLPKGHRWENPLMGWQSSADFMQGHRIEFKSKEDAINFANKQGYEYFVQEPNERKFIPKAYANNFMHSPKKLRHIRTK